MADGEIKPMLTSTDSQPILASGEEQLEELRAAVLSLARTSDEHERRLNALESLAESEQKNPALRSYRGPKRRARVFRTL